MRPYGVAELEIREHSPEWLDEAVVASVDREVQMSRLRLAGDIQASYLGAAAAFNGGEWYDNMMETLNRLASVDDPDEQQEDEDPSNIIQLMAARGEVDFRRVQVSDAPQN